MDMQNRGHWHTLSGYGGGRGLTASCDAFHLHIAVSDSGDGRGLQRRWKTVDVVHGNIRKVGLLHFISVPGCDVGGRGGGSYKNVSEVNTNA